MDKWFNFDKIELRMHCSFAGKLIKIMKIKVDFFVTYLVIINNLLALPV